MNKANECTCPSGDGSLVHPCPAHPAVEQVGGDERAAFELFVRKHCGMPAHIAVNWDAKFTNDAWAGWQARAALAQPSPAHPAPVEQAGGDERAVDGKPRATKCPDCGEGDLMPGDLCACGYETDPAAGYACSECDGSGDGCVGEVCRECDGTGWFVTPEQAHAALAQPSPAQAEQAGGDERAAFFKHLIGRHPAHETEIVRVVEHNYAAWKAWRARAALAQPSGEVVVTKNESGAIVSVTRQDKEGRVLSVIAESATLTAQAEQAEAERPEIVATLFTPNEKVHNVIGFKAFAVAGDCDKDGGEFYDPEKLMTVAQHERIVGALRAERDGAIKLLGQSVWQKIERLTQERDAALARVAELERGKVYVEARQCDECQHGGINDSATGVAACHECDWTGPEPEEDKCPGCQRENCMAAACPQCGARYVLVASEEIAAPVAQAQHSVPEGWVQSLPLKDHQPCKPNEDRANGYTIPIYSRPVLVEEALRKLRAVLCDPIGNVVIDGSDGDREEVQRALGMLAAAPGKEVGHE
ncbi:hypothetical protein LZM19_00915 [Pseudomonas aeruginosa]|nr:hypothetical protein [Pseudomonas aeruginosa]